MLYGIYHSCYPVDKKPSDAHRNLFLNWINPRDAEEATVYGKHTSALFSSRTVRVKATMSWWVTLSFDNSVSISNHVLSRATCLTLPSCVAMVTPAEARTWAVAMTRGGPHQGAARCGERWHPTVLGDSACC